jgi:hypothetical protein
MPPRSATHSVVYMSKRVGALSVAALAISGVMLSGCAPDFVRSSFEDERTEGGKVSEVQVTGGSGSLVVERSPSASSVTVKRKVWYLGDRPERRHDQLDGPVLRLDTKCGDDCSIDYTITVPDAVKVAGRVGSGDIRLTGITGAVVNTGSGDITITDVAESVVAETGSGNVSVSDAKASVTAQTGSGDVRLNRVAGTVNADTGSGSVTASGLSGERTNLRTGSGDVTISVSTAQDVVAKTSSGDVKVTVPKGAAYRVKTNSSSGEKDVTIATDPNGKYQLDLTTESGDISVTDS